MTFHRFMFVRSMLALSCVLVASASFASVETTNGTVDIQNLVDPTLGPPLLDIRILSGGIGSGGIYTNQYDGTAGVSGGIRTISAQLINGATDGVQYSSVRGPAGGALVAITVLDGILSSPGGVQQVQFNSGRLFITEFSTPFDRRDPSSWAGAGLATYSLDSPDLVLPGPDGAPLAPQLGSNLSLPTNVPGDFEASLLFTEFGGANPFIVLDGLYLSEGIYVKALQTLDVTAAGVSVPPAADLDAADLSALNTLAAFAGMSNLGGALTGFATGLGAHAGASTDYYIGPLSTGDLFANLKADAYLVGEVVQVIPEATSIIAWTLLSVGGAVAWRKRNKSQSSEPQLIS